MEEEERREEGREGREEGGKGGERERRKKGRKRKIWRISSMRPGSQGSFGSVQRAKFQGAILAGGLPQELSWWGVGWDLESRAQSGRRLLGTNGGSLWLWCCLAQPGALGP